MWLATKNFPRIRSSILIRKDENNEDHAKSDQQNDSEPVEKREIFILKRKDTEKDEFPKFTSFVEEDDADPEETSN